MFMRYVRVKYNWHSFLYIYVLYKIHSQIDLTPNTISFRCGLVLLKNQHYRYYTEYIEIIRAAIPSFLQLI